MSSLRFIRAAAAIVAAGAALGGAAIATGEPPSDTTMRVSPRRSVAAPARSPVAFAGIPGVAAGRPLPKGYVAVARDVRITRGGESAFAALRMTCPKRTSWRTGAVSGDLGLSVLDRRIGGKRSVLVLASAAARTAAGDTATGTVFALCR